jgi:3-oxoacyl-[acyl-carrier protein] reductase
MPHGCAAPAESSIGALYDPPMSVAGKTAIVTGAGTGIGRATAQLLAERGAKVVAAGLQPERLDEAVAAIAQAGGEAVAAHADVSHPRAIEEVANRAQQAFGGTDILVNNAGIYPLGPWHEMTAEQFDEVFHVNVRGYQLLAQAVRPQMLARGGGAIVNVASVTFWTGMGQLSTYIASKGAVIGLTRALAREAGPDGIRVNAVAPGAFPTAASAIHADQDKLWREVLEAQSIKRRGEVEDVAKAIAFFASDESSFVTGQTLLVDGGWMFG